MKKECGPGCCRGAHRQADRVLVATRPEPVYAVSAHSGDAPLRAALHDPLGLTVIGLLLGLAILA